MDQERLLTQYACVRADGAQYVTPERASRFAKEVAGDFNPLHDADSSRFCVPGDFLFSFALSEAGLWERMSARFVAMVGAEHALRCRVTSAAHDCCVVVLDDDRPVLDIGVGGARVPLSAALQDRFIRAWVAFSGQNFPDVLDPLLRREGVMVNPERPLVLYESMDLVFVGHAADQLATSTDVQIALTGTEMTIDGKRGQILLHFTLHAADDASREPLMTGIKRLTVGGLRPMDHAAFDGLVARYESWRAAFRAKRD